MSGDLHTVFCAECTSNFDWKSVGVFYTHRLIGMPGKITRLLACTEQQRKAYPKRGLEMGPTFIHPNYVNNPRNGESSGSYNKPAAVMHWVSEAQIDETYILFIDADMLLRAPIDPVALGASRGMVVSEHVGYLDQGIRNHLVENFVPEPSMAGLARAAGWYHIFHIDDLRTIAPRWLHYTEVMRTNPQRYWDMNNSKGTWNPAARRAVGNGNHIPTGDAYVEFGEAREQRRALTHVQPSSALGTRSYTRDPRSRSRSSSRVRRRRGSRRCTATYSRRRRRGSTPSCSTVWCNTQTSPRRRCHRTGPRSYTTGCIATWARITSPSTTVSETPLERETPPSRRPLVLPILRLAHMHSPRRRRCLRRSTARRF